MKNASLLNDFAGDPALADVRETTGWKPVAATLLALAFCMSIFFNQPDPEPSRVAMKAAPAPVSTQP